MASNKNYSTATSTELSLIHISTILQAFLGRPDDTPAGDAFERRLYVCRRTIEKKADAEFALRDKIFYVCSMSSVSYTHLDVYKRQESGGKAARRVRGNVRSLDARDGVGAPRSFGAPIRTLWISLRRQLHLGVHSLLLKK